VRLLLAVCVAALFAVPVAHASERHPTQSELEGEVMCPVCGTTLDQSDSPAAQQIKRVIARRIAAGDTKSEIEDRLVANYGDAILAAPPHHGFGLLAWWLPIAGIVAAAAAVGVGAWRWSHTSEPAAPIVPLDPALEQRLDDELRRYES
jgi:cytochrome c-type biogenesis protein CcmH/NrfF